MKPVRFVLPLLFICLSISADDSNLIQSMSFKAGSVSAGINTVIFNEGVAGVFPQEESGLVIGGHLLFNTQPTSFFKPYIDIVGFDYDDRTIYIASVGLTHELSQINSSINPYLSFGIGQAYLDRKHSPVSRTEEGSSTTSSASLSFELGIDYRFSKNTFFDLSVRYDAYDLTTLVAAGNQYTSLVDDSSLSVMLGFTYQFDIAGTIK